MIQQARKLAIFAFAALLLSAPLALATEVTRSEYVASVEPACKTETEANLGIFKGVKKEIKAGELRGAAKRFSRAAKAFTKGLSDIEAAPRPSADENKIAKWIGFLRSEGTLLTKIGTALKEDKKHQVQGDVLLLYHNANLANNAVLGFGFNYCKLNPGRFL
jgi:hypothetical protein